MTHDDLFLADPEPREVLATIISVDDAWWQPHPDRVIPLGITWLSDPDLGAAENCRNAARGFRAVTLPERPHKIGYPSIFDEYWAPIVQACADTQTVICLHVGSSGIGDIPPGCDRAIVPLVATLFGQLSLQACTEWLWAGWTVPFPAALFRHPLPERVLPEGPST